MKRPSLFSRNLLLSSRHVTGISLSYKHPTVVVCCLLFIAAILPPVVGAPNAHLSVSRGGLSAVRAGLAAPFDSATIAVSIRVLPNALGDVVTDSLLNVIDLLRIRDIAIGHGAEPSAFEKDEGDLDRNRQIEINDAVYRCRSRVHRQP